MVPSNPRMNRRTTAIRSLVLLALLPFSGCALFGPKQTQYEKNILNFNVQGIEMGSPPHNLSIFSQVKKPPTAPGGKLVYQVFNPNTHISAAIFWYEANRLRNVELRYVNGSGVETLNLAGGWVGIRESLFTDFGPPSAFGPGVVITAKLPGLDAATAKFNGVWFFTRVNRQLNYTAMSDDETGNGVAAITVLDTKPLKKSQQPKKTFPKEQPPPPESAPGPGFSVQPPKVL